MTIDPPIPPWATAKSTGDYMVKNTQLCTRDGRRCGNAVVTKVAVRHGHYVAHIETDMGNKLWLTEKELKQMFYRPKWVMDPKYKPDSNG